MPRMVGEKDDFLDESDGLCLAEQREKWSREGDFESLWRVLTQNNWTMIDQAECFRLLLHALEVAAKNNPRQFSTDIFAKLIGFTSYLLLRTHFQLGALLDRHDAGMRCVGNLPVPREVIEALPALIQLQEHVTAMTESQARAARMWGLAGKTRRVRSDGETAAGSERVDPSDAISFRVAAPPIEHAKEQA